MARKTIALLGDYSEKVTAHRAIPAALELARAAAGADVAWTWVQTRDVTDAPRDLGAFSGLWVTPASPYENTGGVLAAIRWARETGRPFFGTCGGFQHALLEFAQDVAGVTNAAHEEVEPRAPALLLTKLSCSLVEEKRPIHYEKGSQLAAAMGAEEGIGEFRCNYGLNEAYRSALEAAGMRFTARDDAGDVRGAELPSHPFFCGVLFQPERFALRGEAHPLIVAFVRAVGEY
jgi:CTP synthase (UTP-ammonia lyase)